MKVQMMGETTIAANSTVNNVIQGEKYERAPYNSVGAFYATGSATGLEAELNVGGAAITDTITLGSENRRPIVPDDLMIDGWAAPRGLLIQLKGINTTGGALVMYWKIVLAFQTRQA